MIKNDNFYSYTYCSIHIVPNNKKLSLNKEFIFHSKKSWTLNTNLLINLKQSTLIEIKILL